MGSWQGGGGQAFRVSRMSGAFPSRGSPLPPTHAPTRTVVAVQEPFEVVVHGPVGVCVGGGRTRRMRLLPFGLILSSGAVPQPVVLATSAVSPWELTAIWNSTPII